VSLKKLGRYDLIRVLGKGAMGIVYEGRDPNLDRRVAIKTVKVENLSEEAAAEYEHRFRTEARSAARLQHPNIVSVYDSDRDGDIAFLVMEYIQGDDLKHHLDKGIRYSLEQSLKMIRDLLSALDYAHKQGIVHRDVKPANLLIEPGGRVKLTDFGVARIQDSGEATRTQGSMVGTLKYMSPEQVQGQKIDSRADLFSVGVVLYQLLTDKRPFDGDNDFSIIHQIIGHTPAAPSSFNARLPSAIDAVVARALAKDRDQRFATARDFATALQSAIRRAEDATVVPPADPFKKKDTSGTGSKGALSAPGGASGTSGSAVTQELELLYWKDVRDSTEPDELEGFLVKFPAGIYADLARRRLRKLAGGTSSPDQTILSGAAVVPSPDQDLDATRMRSGTSPSTMPVSPPQSAAVVASVAAAVAAAASPQSVVAQSAPAAAKTPPPPAKEDYTRTIIEPHAPDAQDAPVEPAAMPAKAAVSVPAAAVPEEVVDPQPLAAAAKATAKKPMTGIIALASVAVIVVIAGVVMMSGKGAGTGTSSPAAAASAPIPAASDAGSGSSLNAGQAATDVPAAAALPVAAAANPALPAASVSGASAPRRAASAIKPKAKAASAAAPETARTFAAPLPLRRDDPKPASTPAPAVAASVEVCRDKMFLAKEFCLAEECAKPGSRNHPLCVKHREEVRLREESKIRN
jgi:eukaryotic-like serine/threonine-protein kinase